MLIDWLTLRTPLDNLTEQDLQGLIPYLAIETKRASDDTLLATRMVTDLDAVRSDFSGMVWNITTNGKIKFLSIGASPASLKYGNNLFGSSDYQECKKILLDYAFARLPIPLLSSANWLPRRIDVTQNYFLQSRHQVKDALHILRSSDGMRQKAYMMGGDTVGWGKGSKMRSGKAYDKYTQSLYLNSKAEKQGKAPIYSNEQIEIMQNILRLEMKLGYEFLDRALNAEWVSKDEKGNIILDLSKQENEGVLTSDFLVEQHDDFFNKFIGNSEVTDMSTLLNNLKLVTTEGRARAAYLTYLQIKENGFAHTAESMPRSTFSLHRKYLKSAGLSESDLKSGNIIELRKRKIMMQPVYNWEHLEQLHRLAA